MKPDSHYAPDRSADAKAKPGSDAPRRALGAPVSHGLGTPR